jgi:hypothetical protein
MSAGQYIYPLLNVFEVISKALIETHGAHSKKKKLKIYKIIKKKARNQRTQSESDILRWNKKKTNIM